MFDVFISYAKADRDTARKLANDLSSEGLRVWFDEDQVHPGDQWTEAVEAGLSQARTLIAVISTASNRSMWAAREIAQWFLNDGEGDNGRRLIPVLVERTSLPPSLAGIHYVDLTEAGSYRVGLSQIVNAARAAQSSRVRLPPVHQGNQLQRTAHAIWVEMRDGDRHEPAPPVYVTLGSLDLIASQTVILVGDETVSIDIDFVSPLRIEIQVLSDTKKPGRRVEGEVDGRTIRLRLFNHGGLIGGGTDRPIPIGGSESFDLFFTYRVVEFPQKDWGGKILYFNLLRRLNGGEV